MICVKSNALQYDKQAVCHIGMKQASCLFHFFIIIKINSFLACIHSFTRSWTSFNILGKPLLYLTGSFGHPAGYFFILSRPLYSQLGHFYLQSGPPYSQSGPPFCTVWTSFFTVWTSLFTVQTLFSNVHCHIPAYKIDLRRIKAFAIQKSNW